MNKKNLDEQEKLGKLNTPLTWHSESARDLSYKKQQLTISYFFLIGAISPFPIYEPKF